VCKCVLYYFHRVATQLQLTNISYQLKYANKIFVDASICSIFSIISKKKNCLAGVPLQPGLILSTYRPISFFKRSWIVCSYFVIFVDLFLLVLAINLFPESTRCGANIQKSNTSVCVCRQPKATDCYVDISFNNFIDTIHLLWCSTINTWADDVEVMVLQIFLPIIVNTMLWLTKNTLFCSSYFITLF